MPAGRLYVVSTPIGNPDDLGVRAKRLLGAVALIAAEDTRVARTLLDEHGIAAPRLSSYHDHNEGAQAPRVVEALQAGEDVALISDAGTPLLSDPGYRLVHQAIEAGIEVVPVPGPSALLAALVASGLPSDRFTYFGFPPRQAGKRASYLAALRTRPETLVFYEAPHRILDLLDAAAEAFGDRPACLAVSLTKQWERFHRGPLSQVRIAIAGEGEIRGEMTLVVGGCPDEESDAERARTDELIRRLAEAGVSAGLLRDVVSDLFDRPRRDVYQAALAAASRRD